MAWTPPGAGELRDRLSFQRRAEQRNVGGVVKSDWAELFQRHGRLLPLRGGETIQAARLSGQAGFELVIRFDSQTSALTSDDRVVDARDASRAFDIRSVLDLQGRRAWLVLTLEQGTADGRPGT